MIPLPPLPIDDALPSLLEALSSAGNAVLVAPPGAGKTTRVPPAIAGTPWARGRILMLEPRRLAARAAAERIAAEHGEAVGRFAGYRIRGEVKCGKETRIEVVTEGILTRMLQSDPELQGVSAILFDEVHERSIHSDLGLALALEVQAALRDDLRLVAMSATLDTTRIADVMGGCPVIESRGRTFPVETRWLERPWRKSGDPRQRIEGAVATLVVDALASAPGDLLVFLPGAREIERVQRILGPKLGGVDVVPLYGALPYSCQDRALRAGPRRRVVLATAIAETSLTVEGVRIVVDAGLSRRAQVSPATGMSRLVTVPVSRAEADQRRGRAGRTAPGVCYRLWTKGEEGALPGFAPPEICATDLAPLALELAMWGVTDPADLAFIDQPPDPALAEARALLEGLGALEGTRITPHGKKLAARPAHPRLAHMLSVAEDDGLGAEGALIATLLEERDPLGPGRGSDIALRLAALTDSREDPSRTGTGVSATVDRAAIARIRSQARRIAPGQTANGRRAVDRAGYLLALAYPDRIALRRAGDEPRFLLSGGRGAALPPDDPLSGHRCLVAVDLDDKGREARIRLAATLSEADLRRAHGASIRWIETVKWSRRSRQVEAR
ncbi:MAG: ATP-dependent helicase HrpB, partial [Pseudomonadota bacterium]